MPLSSYFENAPNAAVIIISVALMLICGFAMTRITRRLKLPNVTAYIVTGVLIGPAVFGLVPEKVIVGMDFLADMALAFIAFGIGEFFRLPALKRSGVRVILVALSEALLASLLIFVLCYLLLGLPFGLSLMLAALAAATAPTSTAMTIRQTKAKGDFVDTLLQTIAVDDILGLLAYGVAISVAVAMMGAVSGGVLLASVLEPLLTNLAAIFVGGVFGVLMKLLMPKKRSTDNRLIISLSILFGFCGLCALVDVSPLLGCMSMGTVYINLTGDEKLFRQIGYFSPPMILMFFMRSGMTFRLDTLFGGGVFGSVPLIVVSILYCAVRVAGKYAGSYLGARAIGKPKGTRNYLGLALIPQAGVAVGLAAIGARALGGELGATLETIILASSIIYEIFGPALAKLALYLSGSISDKIEDIVPLSPEENQKSEVDRLIARIAKIREALPEHHVPSEEEEAFDEAAEEAEFFRPPQHYGRGAHFLRRFR